MTLTEHVQGESYRALHRFDLRQALETSDSFKLQNLDNIFTILHIIGIGDAARRADALRYLLCDYDDTLCNALTGIGGALLDGYLQDISTTSIQSLRYVERFERVGGDVRTLK